MAQALRQRVKDELPEPSAGAGFSAQSAGDVHPAGPVKHSKLKQYGLMLALSLYFLSICIAIHIAQFAGLPLYLINKGLYFSWVAMTKQFFCLVTNCVTQWFAPITIRISGDASVRGQLHLTKDGYLKTDFPERLVLIANHQIYTDWLYLWWISYTARMHGHLYIILKESLRFIPFLGPGMIFFGFIFMARNWTKDKPRLQSRLEKLKQAHGGPMSGTHKLDPAWLLIFPEGTNLSDNGRIASKKWADKSGQTDMQHQLLPRSTGTQFCLQELRGTIDWVYDCTIAYEGVARGEFGQDVYPLRALYFEGRAPKSVNMYWRRFAVKDIPIDDPKIFEAWMREKWDEKDRLLEQFMQTGRFPADDGDGMVAKADGFTETKLGPGGHRYIETTVRNTSPFEFLLVYIPAVLICGGLYLLYSVARRLL